MIDPTSEAVAEFEHRLPAAYSQGFAHIRVLTVINPDDPGPLGASRALEMPAMVEIPAEAASEPSLEDMLRAD